MKLSEAESRLSLQLEALYDKAESQALSKIVAEHITGLPRADRLQKEIDLSQAQEQSLKNITQRLLQSEPIQYILGEAPFYGLNLFVNNTVLIPRPETEELVDWIIRDVKQKGLPVFDKEANESDYTNRLKILDVGTGSGCIALALKNKMPLAEVWGCDVSEEALNIARRNGSQLNIRVDFQGVNFLDEQQQRSLPSVDILVSNPPYIPVSGKDKMHANVVAHEPHLALFVADDDAFIFYKALAQFGLKRLHKNGLVYCEIHEDLATGVQKIFSANGYRSIEIKKDMQGKERMIKALAPH